MLDIIKNIFKNILEKGENKTENSQGNKFPKTIKKVQQSNKCIYCGYIFKKPPQRKIKCPKCLNYIYILYDPETGDKKMYSEDDSVKVNKYWERKYFPLDFKELGFTDEHLLKIYDLSIGKNYLNDAKWSLYNEALTKTDDFQKLKYIYLQMAKIVHGEGKDPLQQLQLANKFNILSYSGNQFVHSFEILSAGKGNACDICMKLNGKVFKKEEVINKPILPCKGCTTDLNSGGYGFCRCEYLPIIEI